MQANLVKQPVWVVLWVEWTSGASNTFTLSADGQQITSRTTTARGPVSIAWPTNPGGHRSRTTRTR